MTSRPYSVTRASQPHSRSPVLTARMTSRSGQISVDAGGGANGVVQTLVIGTQVFQAGGIHSHDALGNDRLDFDRDVETLDLRALECGQGLGRDMELDVAEGERAAGQ